MNAQCKHQYIDDAALTEDMVDARFQDAESIKHGYNNLCDKCKRNFIGRWRLNEACRRYLHP